MENTALQALSPYLRSDLDPRFVSQKDGIFQYLNPDCICGDNEKYMRLYNRLAPQIGRAHV